MAKLRIYGSARSRAFRTLWIAEELRLDYEVIELEFGEIGIKDPGFRAINPNNRVPAIDDDGFVMWESLAINLYLAKKHGGGRLYPANPEDEARAWQWSFWAANEVEPPMVTWAMHTVIYPPEKRDPAAAAEAMKRLDQPLAVLDGTLAGQPYLLGAEFSAADLNLASVLYRALGMELAARPHAGAWLKRCYDRPAARTARRLREAT